MAVRIPEDFANKSLTTPVLDSDRTGKASRLHPDSLNPRRAQPDFDGLVDRHARFLYRVAYSLLGNRQDAEDAVQDTFMKLFRTNAWQQTMTDERAYLARAVWRAGLDHLGTAQARAMRHAEDVADLSLTATGLTPEEQAVAAGDRALLQRLLAALPDDLRQRLLLSAIEAMSGAQVAQILGIPEATVRTRLHRARTELRQSFLALTATPQEVRS